MISPLLQKWIAAAKGKKRKELSFTLHQRNTETASPPRLAAFCSA